MNVDSGIGYDDPRRPSSGEGIEGSREVAFDRTPTAGVGLRATLHPEVGGDG